MTEHDLSAWLASIAEVLDEVGVDWALIGALAANRYRTTPRFTTDVDALAEYDPVLVERLEAAGYDVTVVADRGEAPHLLRCYRGSEQVDILLPVIEYQVTALARSIDRVLAVEDVIIHKLIAWRPRDRDDIRSILEGDPQIDTAYLDEWIGEWELADRWSTMQLPG